MNSDRFNGDYKKIAYEDVKRGASVSVRWPCPITDQVRERISPHIDELIEKAESIAKEEGCWEEVL